VKWGEKKCSDFWEVQDVLFHSPLRPIICNKSTD